VEAEEIHGLLCSLYYEIGKLLERYLWGMKGLLLTDLRSVLSTSAFRPRVLAKGQDSLGAQDA